MNTLNKNLPRKSIPPSVEFETQDQLPEKIIQFGEGNFIRGFVDWMVHQLNKKTIFIGKIVAIQPTPHGKVVPKIINQDGLYTLVLQGIENKQEVDKSEIITLLQEE